ncbi:serine/threonine-protein phosphatase [Leptospira fluminis]|uniref:Serine/threonine-protein phosphatase n=1 Tax=Leptospira fluminis TaxID=2484979 RepID=A0A4R9GMC0_9LEPT|nr:PP2C family protein-serine/threonine phosphatase [Leptospira fluminis]TGK15547.1 serine/threonine-protein phosphatase [Leptospira fluminis]
MPTFLDQFKKTLRSEMTVSLFQGAFGVLFFWSVLRFFVPFAEVPHPLLVGFNFLYTISIALYSNYKMVTGRWTANLWANRALLLSLPLPIFYGYFTFLSPDYLPVLIVFVVGVELPVLGLAKSRYLTLWYAAYFSSFLLPSYVWRRGYMEEHSVFLTVFLTTCFFLHFWLVRASDSVKKMGAQLTRSLVQTKQNKRTLKRLHTVQAIDLTLARRLQRDTLPDLKKFESGNLTLSARYVSLDTVGGDFYDVVDLGEGKTGLFIADVSGHGVSAALVTMMTKAAFRNHYREQSDPALLLKIVNRSLCGMLENQGMFVTAFYCIIHPKGELLFSSAGHPPALFLNRRENRIRELFTENTFFLGIEPTWSYKTDSISMTRGDRILIFTDGLIEAKNKIGQQYGEGRLSELLLKKSNLSPEEFSETLMKDLGEFQAGRHSEDDIAFVCCDFRG